MVTCWVVRIVADHLGIQNDLKCEQAQDRFVCKSVFGQNVCWPDTSDRHHDAVSRANCSATCK